jgi:hypothetical protein
MTLHSHAVTPQSKICARIYPDKERGRYKDRLLIWIVKEKVTHKWRGDPLVQDFLTTREENVKKNRLRKLLAEVLEQSHPSLLNIFVSTVTANKP